MINSWSPPWTPRYVTSLECSLPFFLFFFPFSSLFFFNTELNGVIILNWLILTKTGAIQPLQISCKCSYYAQVSQQHEDNVGDRARRVGKAHGESCMERGAYIEISELEAFTLSRTWYVTDRLLRGISVPAFMSRCFTVFHSCVVKISVLSWEASA